MRNVATFFQLLPTRHQILMSVISVVILGVLVIPVDYQKITASQDVIKNKKYYINLPEEFIKEQKEKTNNYNNPLYKSLSSMMRPIKNIEIDKELRIKSGDTLTSLFQQNKLEQQDALSIMRMPLSKKIFRNLSPGKTLNVVYTDNSMLLEMRYRFKNNEEILIKRTQDGFAESIIEQLVETRIQFSGATIQDNFWNAATKSGLSASQIMDIANLFGWDIDFALDIRQGDSFSVLFEERYVAGSFIEYGDIIAADFINQNKHYKAFRYQDGEYYNEQGRSMRKAFLRSPVDFTRVSSNFSMRRMHPVTKRRKPHRGVDYAAPVGTPIKAAGNGRVIASGYNAYNGHYIFIKHNSTYTTKYLHLNRRHLKKGAYVKQGQIIGTVGRSGRVTGPHLHYEFIVNGTHRNPRTVKLPKSKPINQRDKKKFLKFSLKLFDKLTHHKKIHMAYYDNT